DEVAGDTQYLYTKMNSMSISQSSGGRVISVLTTWMANWMELMTKWVSRRPSQVYLQYEKATGRKIPAKNWSQTYKAIVTYMIIIALAYIIKEKTRLRAFEYTGITSLRYLGSIASGEFPGLQIPGSVVKMVTSFLTDDERGFKTAWSEFRRSAIPGVVNQLEDVASAEKDWMTLLFYLEGVDWKIKKLQEKWEPDVREYNELKTAKERDEYRENNPKVEAKMFIYGRLTTLSSDEARTEVLRLIEEHNLDTELIKGYEKVFGVDTDIELSKNRKQLGQVELTETGEQKLKENGELDYYTTSNFATDVNSMVKVMGREKVVRDGNPLAIEYINASDLFVQYENLTTSEARTLHRQQFPDVEASLYLWGKIASFKNPKSAEILLGLMEKYNIPPEAVPAFLDNPERYDELLTQKFELQKKTFDLDTQYENYGNPESDIYIDDEDLRKEARARLKEDNSDWVANNRRIEAIDAGASDLVIEKWAEWGKEKDKFGASSAEAKVWLIDNGGIWDAFVRLELYDNDGTGWNFEVLRFEKKLRKQDEIYGDFATDEERAEYLFNHLEYHQDRRRRDAHGIENFPKEQIETYVKWYTEADLTKPENWDEKLGWYQDDWFLMDNPDFHQTLVDTGQWTELRDFAKVPTKEVFELYLVYNGLPLGQTRIDYRTQNRNLNDGLVNVKGLKPLEGRGDKEADLSALEEIGRKARDIERRLAGLGR
ncbi:hypothetical protein LCGC14_1990790, partial [marine sediment metagenome]